MPDATGTAPAPAPAKLPRDLVSRWGGHAELFDRGWVGVPYRFLEHRAEMKPFNLTPTEAIFIVDLMAHKWDEKLPWPGYKRLSKWMGKSESYVRKVARGLEIKGLLKRHPRIGDTNLFDLEPLFARLVGHIKAPPPPVRPRKRRARGKAKRA